MANPDQFTSLFVKHERRLFSFVAAMLGNQAEAEDLLQETANLLWKKFDEYDPSKPFLPWAKTFARYQIMNYLSRQKTRRKYFSEGMLEILEERWEEMETQQDDRIRALESCMEGLPDNSRRLIKERYHGANNLQTVATKEETSPNALYKTLQRIRKALRECINQRIAEGLS